MDDRDIISGFENDTVHDSGSIDFDVAQRLDRDGSTCDVYVTRYHRRRVFVKRLKEQFRSNSVYRAALDKEFDLGVGLRHKSLPDYREYHGDYIVMDYIDGVTLAEALKCDADAGANATAASRWLRRPNNLKRMLKELIEAIGYLHRHNIVHCDVKPDNIILTDGTFNLMLIDFDKSYTSWLDDTSGSPALYDVAPSRRGDTVIDFHGIGKIIDALIAAGYKCRGLNRLRARCFDDSVTADELLKILDRRPTSWQVSVIILIAVVLSGITVWLWINTGKKDNNEPLVTEHLSAPVDTTEMAETSASHEPETIAVKPVETILSSEPAPKPKVNIEELVTSTFAPLYEGLDLLEGMIGDQGIRPDHMRATMLDFANAESYYIDKLYKAICEARNYSDLEDGAKAAWKTRAWWEYAQHKDSIWNRVTGDWLSRIPGPKPANSASHKAEPSETHDNTNKTQQAATPPNPNVDVESLLTSMFRPLYQELDKLEAMIADTTLTADEIHDSLMAYLDIEKDCHGKAYKAVNKARNYSDPWDGPKEVWQTKAWSSYMHYSDSVERIISNEWRARIPKK